MKRLTLKLGHTSTTAIIGSGLNREIVRAALELSSSKTAVLIYDRTLNTYATQVEKSLRSQGLKILLLPVAANEKVKELSVITALIAKMLGAAVDRRSVVIALGGGAVGDAAGFVASIYLRGIPWIGVPTTLLAQVDSSIGGKTGINHPLGKNLIGTFHQPRFVFCDLNYLKTLPEREKISGLGEILKYGLIYDRSLLHKVERNLSEILKFNAAILEELVARSIGWKMKAVKSDERDLKGVREVLNFGHTLGHVFEALLGYGKIRHGEAVMQGMRVATQISVIRGHLSIREGQAIEKLLVRFPLPKLPKIFSAKKVEEYILRDKKKQSGKVRFVLLRRIGATVLDKEVSLQEVREALARIGVTLR